MKQPLSNVCIQIYYIRIVMYDSSVTLEFVVEVFGSSS